MLVIELITRLQRMDPLGHAYLANTDGGEILPPILFVREPKLMELNSADKFGSRLTHWDVVIG